MKVLVVAPGDSQHTKRWIERLNSTGISCVFLDMTPPEDCLDLPLIPVYRISTGQIYAFYKRTLRFTGLFGKCISWIIVMLKTRILLRKILEIEQPQLINLHWLFHPMANAIAVRPKLCLISTPWGSDLLAPEYQSKVKIFHRLFHEFALQHVVKNSSYFCCDAPHMRELLTSFGADEDSIELIYFGTDLNRFNPILRDSDFRKEWGISDEDILVLSNRQLAEVYDIPTLLYAFSLASQLKSRLKLLVVGGGPLRERLQDLAIELDIHGKVAFSGRLSDQKFATATASADIYVSTSTTDGGIAASVAEAMASEVPVIITRFGDNAKWIRDETAGLLFDAGNAIQLSECILKLAESVELRRSMGKIARQVILLENNSEIELTKVLNLYRKAVH